MKFYFVVSIMFAFVALMIVAANAWYVIFKTSLPWAWRIWMACLEFFELFVVCALFLGSAYVPFFLNERFNTSSFLEIPAYLIALTVSSVIAVRWGNGLARFEIATNSRYLGSRQSF